MWRTYAKNCPSNARFHIFATPGPRTLVYSRLDEKMTKGFHDVYAMHERHSVNMREAAYLVSVSRVAEACKLRGWV